MDKKLLKFTEEIKKALGGNLKSFVLYGSAVTGEYYKTSDFNTIIILNDISYEGLTLISRPVKKWVKQGNPVPLIFTGAGISRSTDVFPLEFTEIKENHRVLFGSDFFKKIRVSTSNLRLECERELKSVLLRLSQAYIMTEGNPKNIKKLMRDSISTVTALFKGVLRLYRKKTPVKKRDIIGAMPADLKLNKQLFSDILSLKDGNDMIPDSGTVIAFKAYIRQLESVIDAVDKK
jgi:predicted nucleotidyltransferase